jgi:hypothetical protein
MLATRNISKDLVNLCAACAIAWCALTNVVRAAPASPAGAAAIQAKWLSMQSAWNDPNADISATYAAYWCATASGTPQMTPDGRGAYLGYIQPVTGAIDCAIYWTPSTGAHAVWGAIWNKFSADGWEVNDGYPITDVRFTPSMTLYGWFSRLDASGNQQNQLRVAIYDSSWGPHTIRGPRTATFGTTIEPVLDSWSSRGWETGVGFPTSDSVPNDTANTECWTSSNRGCTNGANGTQSFNRWQAFKKYDGSVWRLTCACMNGSTIVWKPMN